MRQLFVPPIVVPAILVIGILAYALLRAPILAPNPSPIAVESVSPASK